MRKRIGFIFMGIGAALVVAALSLLLFNRAEDKNAGNAADEILPAVIAAIEEPLPTGDDSCEDDPEMTVVDIYGYGYIGYLMIPALNLKLPVMSEWDDTRLKTAPCRYYGSVKTDDLVIAGHNYGLHFGRLKNLQTGDAVFFTDMDGVTAAYEVAEVETLQPTEIGRMLESGYALTLYTCTYGGQSRLTVRCSRGNSL